MRRRRGGDFFQRLFSKIWHGITVIQISDLQMISFSRGADERIIMWHCNRLMQRFPDLVRLVKGAPVVFVDRNRTKALEFDIDREDDIALFLDCSVMFGEGFSEQPWAKQWLSISVMHGHDRMAQVHSELEKVGIPL